MSKENTTEFILLGLLTHEDLSGYDLKKAIDRMISQFWEVGYGQLYPTLRSLEEGGFIQGRSEPSAKGPERKVYSITPSGRAKLTAWLVQPTQREYVKYEILLKVFFGGQLPPEQTLNRITDFKQRNTSSLHLLEGYMYNLEQVMDEEDDHLYFSLTVLFGEYVYRAYTAWAEEAEARLKAHFEKKEEKK